MTSGRLTADVPKEGEVELVEEFEGIMSDARSMLCEHPRNHGRDDRLL